MLFVGPNDLCSSMGYPPPDHPNIPEVQDAIERIRAAAHSAGKYAGMFCTQPEQVSRSAFPTIYRGRGVLIPNGRSSRVRNRDSI